MKVDHLLCSTLFGKKEAPEVDSAVPSAGLRRRLLDKLLPWHRITRPGGEGGRPVEVLRRGGLKPITVTAERRRGHNVTAVARVEGFGFVAEELAGAFARGLKTASSVSRLPGKAESDSEILLQGELLKQVERYFVEVAGLERAHLELVNKAKK
jgi:translation initiation factor 1 (eIF-1/SUI1)